jgi:mannan endo-1,4-beta-mannosidase
VNRASFVAKLMAVLFVVTVAGGAGAVVWVFQHHSLPKTSTLLPNASSAPHPINRPLSVTTKYLGVFEPGAPYTYQPITDFSAKAKVKIRIVDYFSAWGRPFHANFATAANQHGAVLLVQMEPRAINMAQLAAGSQDKYLHAYAEAVRAYGYPVILSFAPEADGPWYSWGNGHTKASDWIAAYRHLVTVFRQAGAVNVTWLWDMSERTPASGPLQDWWPGSQYVTWVGLDGYYIRSTDSFASVFGKSIAAVRKFTDAPLLISEVAVGTTPDRAKQIAGLFAGAKADHLLGLVWFDQRQHDPPYHLDWRLEDDPAAMAAYSAAAAQFK